MLKNLGGVMSKKGIPSLLLSLSLFFSLSIQTTQAQEDFQKEMMEDKQWVDEMEKQMFPAPPISSETVSEPVYETEIIPQEEKREKEAEEVSGMPTISMDFQNANMKNVLKIFSQQSGLNFIAGEDIADKRITLYLEKVSVEDALNTILSANKLTYEQKPGSNIFVVKKSAEPEVETVTKVFMLSYAQAKEGGEEGGKGIKEVIEDVLTEHGRVICYGPTNSLIITDIPANFERIEKTIKDLDIPTPQVMIEAEILETVAGLTEKLGVDWSTTLTWTAPTSDLWPTLWHGGKFPAATLTAADTRAVIDLLFTDAHTKYLAKPKVCVLNNEEAVIDITADMVVGVTTVYDEEGKPTSEEIERMDIGTKLIVTPHINNKDEVVLELEPEVSRASKSSLGNYMDKLKRAVNTKVRVKDGNTVIIGGLLSHNDATTKRKVFFFGDIPLLGNLFKYEGDTQDQTEIVIFITPHIMKYGEGSAEAFPEEKEVSGEEVLELEPIVVN